MSGFTVSPSVGYFFTSNVALGARIGYTNVSVDNSVVTAKEDVLSAGVFGRYYWMPQSKFSIFAELGFDYASASVDSGVSGSVKTKTNGFSAQVAPGISYFVSPKFALEAKTGVLGYSSVKPDVAGAVATNGFSLGLNLNDISLGLVYKF